ncbi:MAG TPA: Rossmann-like domain-containing protein [Candidatus Hypogeohydataceae bacterium YC41]
MKILQNLIHIIENNRLIERFRLRPVDIRLGVFYTCVKLSSGHAGLAYTPIHDLPEAICCPKAHARMPQAGELLKLYMKTLMDYALEENPLRAAIGVATLNALSAILLDEKDCPYKVAGLGDVLDMVEIRKEDTVGMIGAFPPFIKRLKETCGKLHVFEKNPWLAKEVGMEELQPENLARDILPHCDVLIITGVTLVNHTLEPILKWSGRAREIVLVGPTASLYPEPLFQKGVTTVGGIRINNADRVMEIISQGGSGYDLFERYADRIVLKRIPSPISAA